MPLLLGGALMFAGWQARAWYEDSVTLPKLQREIEQAKAERAAAEARERAADAARTQEGLEADAAEAALRKQLRDAHAALKSLPAADLGRSCLSRDAVRLYNAAIGAGPAPVPKPATVVSDTPAAGQPSP